MKITAITQQKKYEQNVNIFVDNEFWVSLNKNQLLEFELFKGKEISQDEKLKIEEASSKNKIMQRIYVYLQSRPRSRKEILDHFVYKKQIDSIQVNGVLDELEKNGIINDYDFAKWYIGQRRGSGFHGPNKIKAELIKKGVDARIIKELFELGAKSFELGADETEKSGDNSEREKIKEYVLKVKDKVKAKDEYDRKRKIYQRLMARGYNFDDFKGIVDEVMI